jgi:hypothetical protein
MVSSFYSLFVSFTWESFPAPCRLFSVFFTLQKNVLTLEVGGWVGGWKVGWLGQKRKGGG